MEQLFATPISQPSRSVSWLCKLNKHSIEYIHVNPVKGESRTVTFREMNPMGKIPVLKDGDWILTESNAIMYYLAEKYGWVQWYPKDLKIRARIHEYLNWHHHNARRSSEIFLATLMANIGRSTPALEAKLKNKDQTMKTIFTMMEHWLSHGRDQRFLVTESHPTLADIACYHEVVQLKVMGLMQHVETKYPKVALWMEAMKSLPYHDEELAPMMKFFQKFDLIDKFNTSKL